ncbi:MAG: Hpt domain-containing protein [Solirubrobacteraceae bacterium]
MDTADYLPMFLAESREHLQELNLAIVRLERGDGRPGETLEEIFRAAHSLKGMSATMGFAAMAALTHEMEAVMEPLRGADLAVDRRLVDALLAGLDALERAVDGIEADGQERLDVEPHVAALRAAVTDDPDDAAAAAGPGGDGATGGADGGMPATAPDDDPVPSGVRAAAGDRQAVRITATLADDCAMPGVRAFMVLAVCEDLGDVVHSTPAVDAAEGFAGRRIVAWVAGDEAPSVDVVGATVGGVGDVVDVDVWAAPAVDGPVPEGRFSGAPTAEPVVAGASDAGRATTPDPDGPTVPDGEPTVTAGADGGTSDARSTGAAPTRRASSVRVDADRLDQLMHGMGELVVHRTRLEALLAHDERSEVRDGLQDLQRSSQALHQLVMQVRMIPVDAVFMRFPRLVRDLASRLEKRVDLQLVGRDTELDRTVVDALGDPLVHLVRNALDHGLEDAAERTACGKEPVGTLTIAARQSSGQVIISVTDDGRGIDPAKVARRAIDRGLLPADQAVEIDARRAVELLFAPGFSTVEQASDISGRGVGMDAVRTSIRGLGGEVTVRSVPGTGTTTEVRLPLTLAITSGLLVDIAGQPYAVPLDRVERIVRLADENVRSAVGRPVLVQREGTLPLLDGPTVLGEGAGEPTETPFALVLRGHDRAVALTVTRLDGQRELVTRPMPSAVARHAPVAGGAVLAGGEIALVVDVDQLTADVDPATPALPGSHPVRTTAPSTPGRPPVPA